MMLKENIRKIFEQYLDGLTIVNNKDYGEYNLEENEKFNLFIKSYKVDENRQIEELLSMGSYANTLDDRGLDNLELILDHKPIENGFTSFSLHDRVNYTRQTVLNLFSQSSDYRKFEIEDQKDDRLKINICDKYYNGTFNRYSIEFTFDEYDRLIFIVRFIKNNDLWITYKIEKFEYNDNSSNKPYRYSFENFISKRKYYSLSYDMNNNETLYNYYNIIEDDELTNPLFYTFVKRKMNDNTSIELGYAYLNGKMVLDQIEIKEYDNGRLNIYNLIGNDSDRNNYRNLFNENLSDNLYDLYRVVF